MGQDGKEREIVGVVGDVHGVALADAPAPTVYIPIDQVPFPFLTIVARTHLPAASLATPMRGIVRALDRNVPVYSVQSLEAGVAASVDRQRFYATLVGSLAGVALALSAVGLYGVIAYGVSQRTHELGLRVALGATSGRLSRMVIREGVMLTAAGLAIGIVVSLFAERLVASLLFGVKTFDPWTVAWVVVVLGGVAAAASWLPARRAARSDPLVAMRGN
jgi:putative ABC transport system permease protein